MNYCAGGLSFIHSFLQAWLLLCASLMIPYSASALCLFLSVVFNLPQSFFFSPHNSFGGDGIQLSKRNASSYQERKMFALFAQVLAVKQSEVFTATSP